MPSRTVQRATFFPGDSEMARRMDEFDWSATLLGPPDSWPHSLQTAVRILLTSRYAMWLGWGPDLIFLYNDAYKPTLGVKHPAALGWPAQQVWNDRLKVVHRNGLRLLKLVNTLLDFSRIESARIQASYEPVDLGALTADIASNFRAACEMAGLNLVIACRPFRPPDGEMAYVDRDMCEKIVLNLVSNAFKFTLEGTIVVSLVAEDGYAKLVVTDTGSGIPVKELPHLFERFYRVEGAVGRTGEGSGIGLALVEDLVKLHGGTVRVTSSLGHGSSFSVSIPWGTLTWRRIVSGPPGGRYLPPPARRLPLQKRFAGSRTKPI